MLFGIHPNELKIYVPQKPACGYLQQLHAYLPKLGSNQDVVY